MKRSSKAEQALAKQVRNLEVQIESINAQISELVSNRETLSLFKDSVEMEIFNLSTARKKASERAKS